MEDNPSSLVEALEVAEVVEVASYMEVEAADLLEVVVEGLV